MTEPVRPPSDIRVVCEDHPNEAELNSWTNIYAHLTAEHPNASPVFEVTATGYPAE